MPGIMQGSPNYMLYAFPNQLEKPKALGEPCMIPGIPYPPGCEDSGGNPGNPPPGKTPCIIPGIPYPPGCEDSGNPPGNPGNPGNPPNKPGRPAIPETIAEPSPAADPDIGQAWGIAKVSADKAWAKQKGSKNI